MSERLEVDTDGLVRLAGDLDGIRHELICLSSAGQVRADLGSAEVWDAVEYFETRWRDGRDRLERGLMALSSTACESAAAFTRVDGDLGDGISGAVSSTPSSTDTAGLR